MSALGGIVIRLDGIGHVLSDNMLAVPIYQRPYAWGDRQVKQLFEDLSAAIRNDDREYFLGSIVVTYLHRDRAEVVDGQQRLATITILLSAIRDYFLSHRDIDTADLLERRFLLTRHIRTLEIIPRLRLGESDQDFFLDSILGRPGTASRSANEPQKDSHRRLAYAASLAERHVLEVAERSGEARGTLLDWVAYIEDRARVIWVQVPDHADAFTIFETLNDRGLDLAVTDLLKNHLLHLSRDRIGLVQRQWASIFDKLDSNDEGATAVVFIRHLWSSTHGLTRERELYDRIRSTINTKAKALQFSEELEEAVSVYAAILDTDHRLWKSFGSRSRIFMDVLNAMGMVAMRPLVLAVLQSFTPKEVERTLHLMVCWATRFLIVGGLGSGRLEELYAQLAVNVRRGEARSATALSNAASVVPSDTEFRMKFATVSVSKSKLARYYLTAIERELRGLPYAALGTIDEGPGVGIEHVMPLGTNSGSRHDASPDLFSEYAKRLGNMTLLENDLNTMAGNFPFESKRELYARSAIMMTRHISSFDVWGPAQIDLMQIVLADLAVRAWRPTVS